MSHEKKYFEIAPGIFVTKEQLEKLQALKKKKAKEQESHDKKKSN